MTPTWATSDGAIRLYLADCLSVLPTLEAGSVDCIVTDPPYGHNNNNGDLIHRWLVRSPTTAQKLTRSSATFCQSTGEF